MKVIGAILLMGEIPFKTLVIPEVGAKPTKYRCIWPLVVTLTARHEFMNRYHQRATHYDATHQMPFPNGVANVSRLIQQVCNCRLVQR